MPTREIEVGRFASRVMSAFRAFSSDPEYAVQVVTAASGIQRKRRVWQLRLDARAAEREAKLRCSQEHFQCVASSPCGFGDCKFASVANSLIEVSSCSGESIRPQYSRTPTYSREVVVTALIRSERLA